MRNMSNCVHILAFTAWLSYGYCRVNDFIGYFEALDYASIHKQLKNGRHASGELMDKTLLIDFKAFGRSFKLMLRQDDSSSARATEKKASDNRSVYLYPNSVVAGYRAGEKTTRMHGWITDSGLFYGTIKSSRQTFQIVPAEKFFKNANFHSVIYQSESSELSSKDLQGLDSVLKKYGSGKQALHSRKRRDWTNRDGKIRNVCRLSLEADYTFLKMSGSPERAVSVMVSRIKALNKVFRKSFVSSHNKDNNETISTPQSNDSVVMQFRIAKVRVYNASETARVLGPGALDAATFLRLMQKPGGYSQFCLALFFTARSFTQGVVGVTNPGGACTNSKVGVVSFAREGMVLPPLVTEINVAHVVGHAFGAKYDQDSCQPVGNVDGDFIMTKFGLNGDQPNNFLYSPCSVQQIQSFVDGVQNVHCLEQGSWSLSDCGNGVVDYGEECDCGDETMCAVLESGNCCDFTSCKLKAHAICSVSNGFCCDGTTCNYKNAGKVCSFETECSEEAVCSGNSSTCPQPLHKANFLECNWNSSVCLDGVCSGKSVCAKFGLDSCSCKDKVNECKICCLDGGKCWPAQNITKIKSRLKSIYLSAGSLCANRTGYCDVFHECHPITLNAPFSDRYEPYVRKKGMKEITHSFWWAIFLGTVALIASVVMIIKHGALYTSSSDPELNELEPAKTLPRFKLSRLKSDEEKEIILSDGLA